MITEKERLAYRRRYIRLANELNQIAETYDCGNELMGFMNPRAAQLVKEIDELVAEVNKRR